MDGTKLSLLTFEQAVEKMRDSQPVIFPTETFFGLGSRALDANASARVFRAKHRLTGKPLPLILGDFSQLEQVAKVPIGIMPLLERFWPGPLTMILSETSIRSAPSVMPGRLKPIPEVLI